MLSVFVLCWLIFGSTVLFVKTPRTPLWNTSSSSPFAEFANENPRPVHRLVITVFDALRWDWLRPQDPQKPFIPETGLPLTPIHNQYRFAANATKQLSLNARMVRTLCEAPTMTVQRVQALTTGSIPDWFDATRALTNFHHEGDSIIRQWATEQQRSLVFVGDDTWLNLFPTTVGRKSFTHAFAGHALSESDVDTVDRLVNQILWRHMIMANRDPLGNKTYCYGTPGILPRFDIQQDMQSAKSSQKSCISGDWDVLVNHWLGADAMGHVFKLAGDCASIRHKLYDQVISNTLYLLTNRTIGQDVFTHKTDSQEGPAESMNADYELPNFSNALADNIVFDDQVWTTQNRSIPGSVYALFLGDHGATDHGSHGGKSKTETDAGLFAFSSLLLTPDNIVEEEWLTDAVDDTDKSPTIRQIDMAATLAILTGAHIPAVNEGLPAIPLLPFYPFTKDPALLQNQLAKTCHLRYLAHWHWNAARNAISGATVVHLDVDPKLLDDYTQAFHDLKAFEEFDKIAEAVANDSREAMNPRWKFDDVSEYQLALKKAITTCRRLVRSIMQNRMKQQSSLKDALSAICFSFIPSIVLMILLHAKGDNCFAPFSVPTEITVLCTAVLLLNFKKSVPFRFLLLVGYIVLGLYIVKWTPVTISDLRRIRLGQLIVPLLITVFICFQSSHYWAVWNYHKCVTYMTLICVSLACSLQLYLAVRHRSFELRRMMSSAGLLLIILLLRLVDPLVQDQSGVINAYTPLLRKPCFLIIPLCFFAHWQSTRLNHRYHSFYRVRRCLNLVIAITCAIAEYAKQQAQRTLEPNTEHPWLVETIGKISGLTHVHELTAPDIYRLSMPKIALFCVSISCILDLLESQVLLEGLNKKQGAAAAQENQLACLFGSLLWLPVIIRPPEVVAVMPLLLMAIPLVHETTASLHQLLGNRSTQLLEAVVIVLMAMNAHFAQGLRSSIEHLPLSAGAVGLQRFNPVLSILFVIIACTWPFVLVGSSNQSALPLLLAAHMLLITSDQFQVLWQIGESDLQLIVSSLPSQLSAVCHLRGDKEHLRLLSVCRLVSPSWTAIRLEASDGEAK